jgi:hypothetical protein
MHVMPCGASNVMALCVRARMKCVDFTVAIPQLNIVPHGPEKGGLGFDTPINLDYLSAVTYIVDLNC